MYAWKARVFTKGFVASGMVPVQGGPAFAKVEERRRGSIDFVRDAFGHLKAIAIDAGAQVVLKAANVGKDKGIIDAADTKLFIAAARIRQWDREAKVRMLA